MEDDGMNSSSRELRQAAGGVREPASVGFTRGPWRCSRTMRLVGAGVAAPWVCQVEDQGVSRARFEANARLISAAPDLLEALTTLTDSIEHAWPSMMSLGPLVDARAAIAKALGREAASPAERMGQVPGGPLTPTNSKDPAHD